MLKHEAPVDGFKSRPDYTRKSPVGRKVLKWTAHAVSRTALYFVQRIAEDQIGATSSMSYLQIERRFKEHGINEVKMLADLKFRCPGFAEWFEAKCGAPLAANKVYDRAHKGLFYKTGKKGMSTPGLPTEHYTNSKALKPRVTAMCRLYLTQKPVTITQMEEAGR